MKRFSIVLVMLVSIHSYLFAIDEWLLNSWNNGKVKDTIISFVQNVSNPQSPCFVPQEDRIATFDNDGTLWSEKPTYFQLMFAIDQIKLLAQQHPEWKEQQPYKTVLEGNKEDLLKLKKEDYINIIALSHAGQTTEQFQNTVRDWLATAIHPRFHRPYTQMTYRPMRELLDYLRANGFKTYIVSGGGTEFLRVLAPQVYGIPPEQVIGSRIKIQYQDKDGTPELMRLPEIDFIDDGPGKPVGIYQQIGRRPIFAFGNSDGDFQMLDWITSGSGPRLGLLVHHDDAIREWSYDKDSLEGKLDRALRESSQKGWVIVSMKDNWNRVY